MPTMTKQRNNPLHQFIDGVHDTSSKDPLPLESTTMKIRILGGIAIVSTERVFKNSEAQSIEATVTFPVPVHAQRKLWQLRRADAPLAHNFQN